MQLDLAPIHHFILKPEDAAPGTASALAESDKTLPWTRPLDERMRAALLTGVLLAFVIATLVWAAIRASLTVHDAQEQVRTEARTLASGLGTALARRDREMASLMLQGMMSRKLISGAAIYDRSGARIASYARSEAVLNELPIPGAGVSPAREGMQALFPHTLLVWEAVHTPTAPIGWLVMQADLQPNWQTYFLELAWVGATLLGTLLLCAAIVSRVQRRMAEPLFRLEKTAKVIVEDRDYTLRTWKDARNEVGNIADGFNHLLDEIQQRGRLLIEARGEIASIREEQAHSPIKTPPVAEDTGRNVRGQILANMAHEIRTPLTRAATACRDLEATALSTPQRAMLHSIRGTSELVLAVADDVLVYTRIESGKLELQPTECSPRTIVDEVVRMYQERAQAKRIKLTSAVDHTMPSRFRGDPARIRQVIGNLVANCIKFSQGGEIRVEMRADKVASQGAQLHVAVRDSGFGIAEEARMRIYAALSQENADGALPSGSAGLGLHIAQHLIQRMGGQLQLIDDADTGSGYQFSIAVGEVAGAEPEPTPVATAHALTPTASREPAAKRTALILDEGLSTRKSLRQLLHRMDMEAEVAADLDEVLTRCAHQPFSFIFVSRQSLSDTNAVVSAIRQAARHELNKIGVPIIGTYHRKEGKPNLQGITLDGFLPYPFRRKEVEEVLSSLPVATHGAGDAVPSGTPVMADAHRSEAVADLVQIYLDATPEMIEQLESALSNDDAAQSAAMARTLGVCSAKVGAIHLAALCKTIESFSAEGKLTDARNRMQDVHGSFDRARQSLLEEGMPAPSSISGHRSANTSMPAQA